MPGPAYFLSKHAFACLSGGSMVLLDLKADRYLALEASRARSLAGLVAGWPQLATGAPLPTAEAGNRIAAGMLKRGLLTSERSQGKELTPPPVAVPADSAIDTADEGEIPLRLKHLLSFVAAVTAARFHLRFRSMEWIVDDVRRRRARAIRREGEHELAIRQWARLFDRMRAFTYNAYDACLFDSLAMLYFLLREGLQPQWVIGVRSSPSFMAHSWIQHGETLLNDSLDRVSVYTPIMAA
ncbi:MAG TPA: lasso peptide biosynthesis B2 protein [Steroidobacter sp.]|uniref:lasso peptide biosynthesis B2 protein n=1 Tax=Steroidobacter sp. TaxID=1978227 RepID=UPI002ED9FD5B